MVCPHCLKNFFVAEQLPECPHPFIPGLAFDDQRRRGTANVDTMLVQWESGNQFHQDLGGIYLDGVLFPILEVQGEQHISLAEPAFQRRNVLFVQVNFAHAIMST